MHSVAGSEFQLSASLRGIVWFLLACTLLGITGCSGCRQETPQERIAREQQEKEERERKEEERRKAEQAKKEKKHDFEIKPLVSKPSELNVVRSLVKPGHWMTATQEMRANYFDWAGESSLRVVDDRQRPYPIEKTPFQLASSRPVQLAKGQSRHIESLFLVPHATKKLFVDSRLRERNYGSQVHSELAPLTAMPPYQYFFVVLAKEPQQYAFLKSLNVVAVPQDTEHTSDDLLHYQVLLPTLLQQVPLPENPLCWTPIAYVLWDEVEPDQLSPQHQAALVDWLHWGGQLLVSGPDSLALLKSSFLAPYLPATDGGVKEYPRDSAEVQQLEAFWTAGRSRPKPLRQTTPWSGIELELAEGVTADEGLAAATGGLFVERRVGRGRVVVSAIQIAQRDLLAWSPHYDDLFNAGLMRRAPRTWKRGPYGQGRDALHGEWADMPNHKMDAAYVTSLRLFARDVHADPAATNYRIEAEEFEGSPVHLGYGHAPGWEPLLTVTEPEVVGGIGAWNDFNATSTAARQALRKAAGVKVPNASFVVVCLAVYLVVLVPLNWLFFKALGRVEYAWAAAPVIALAGTAIVVKQAQLDIGFVRAQTEIGLLEIHGQHPRAHLTRYTALYTSLSTTYDAVYDDPTAVAAPFPTKDEFEMLLGQSRSTVELTQASDVKLAGLAVSSATTDMMHSEQLYSLDGPLTYRNTAPGVWQVTNNIGLPLSSVGVVERREKDPAAPLYGCWIGTLQPGETKPVQFTQLDPEAFASERATVATSADEQEQLDLEPLFQLAFSPQHIDVGEVRLVGRVDKVLPGVTIGPRAAQMRGASLVVAHLDHAPLPPPRRDTNTPRDILRPQP